VSKVDPTYKIQVLSNARGHWVEIYQSAGIYEQLPQTASKGVACPRCGGEDRFFRHNGFEETGSTGCRKCKGSNDGLATLRMFLTHLTFREALDLVASVVGVTKPGNQLPTGGRSDGTVPITPNKPKKQRREFATLQEAITATTTRLAKGGFSKTGEWPYRDVEGNLIGMEVRFDSAKQKQVLPFGRSSGGWVQAEPDVKWPLYNLEAIEDSHRIFITEGAKACDVVIGLDMAGTTSSGGSGKFSHTDWTPLAGKEVFILPDNDEPGRKYADGVSKTLKALEPAAKVREIALPGLPPSGDVVDWVARTFGDAAEPEVIASRVNQLVDDVLRNSSGPLRPQHMNLKELAERYPELCEPIVDGLIRRGEVANIINAPKAYKTFMVMMLAFRVAMGREFLGMPTTRGRVLIIDNELDPTTIQDRMTQVREALKLSLDDIGNEIRVEPIRGRVRDLYQLEQYFTELVESDWQPDLIILDAFYRFLPEGTSENDNAAITQLFNQIDRYAYRTNAAIVNVHHTSKGDQSGKTLTDIGAGAGAMSRATDCHLVMLPHKLADCAVLQASVRSFPPMKAFTIKFTFPLWERKDAIKPELKTRQRAGDSMKDAADNERILRLFEERQDQLISASQVRNHTGISRGRVDRLVAELREAGLLKCRGEEVRRGNLTVVYAITEAGQKALSDVEGE